MPAAIGGALNASQVDGDAMPGRGGPELVEVSSLRLNRLSRVFGEDLFCRVELNRAPSVRSSQNG